MNPETLKRWGLKLWPELADYPAAIQQQGFLLLSLIFTLSPYFPLALGWLVFVTDWSILRDNVLILLFLLVVNIVIEQRPYLLLVRFNEEIELPLSGSLSGIIETAAFFIFGPSALWLGVVSGLLHAIWMHIQARRNQNEHPLWSPLNSLLQTAGLGTLTKLVGITSFLALGGRFPLASTQPQQWLPALLALLVMSATPLLFYVPMLVTMNRFNGIPNNRSTLLPVLVSAFLMSLSTVPFAIPLAVVYTHTGTAVFITIVLGVAFANLLAYSLSRASINNQARVDDLAWLERVSEAMIQAPPDASTLAALLEKSLPRQFRQQHVVIKLFALDAALPWPTFEVAYPPDTANPQPPIDWDALRQNASSYQIVHNVPARQNMAAIGHELYVKIMVPLHADGEPVCVGGIYLHRDRTMIRPLESILALLQNLANQIGAALNRARSHVDMLAQQKMAQELAVAGRIQASFLPTEIPQLPGYEIAATLIPARETSGDFYDFVPLDNGRIGLIVADVADKGTGAALYMALSRTLIRTYAMQYPDEPGKALAAANERILADTESDQFVTVFYGVLHPESGNLVYANAGHNPAFLIGSETVALAHTGIPLGMFPDMAWQHKTVTLAAGDLLVMYSDGVSEAQDVAQAEFGEARLLAAAGGRNGRSAQAVQDGVITAVTQFVGAAPQFDDITLMVVRSEI